MFKVRVCPKCGKIENQFMYFCTGCGWKTESQEIQTDYKAVKTTEKSELHIDEKATSIDKKLISQKTKMADIIMILINDEKQADMYKNDMEETIDC